MPATYGAAGTIAGDTPTKPGTYTFTVHVTPFGATTPEHHRDLQHHRRAAAAADHHVPRHLLQRGHRGLVLSAELFSSGGYRPFIWTVTVGQPPPGVTLTGSHLSGTPATVGTSRLTIKVTGSAGNHAPESGSITISP
jgi:hypothetical protein